MVRSLGFGSIIYDISNALFRLVFTLATESFFNHAKNYKSPAHSSTGMRSILFTSHRLIALGFIIYFTPVIGVLFHLSLAVLFAISDSRVFSLTRWSSLIHKGFHVPQATRDIGSVSKIENWTFTVYGAGFSCFNFLFCLNFPQP